MGAEILAAVAFVGMLLACYRIGAERSAREAQAARLSALERLLVEQAAALRRRVESLGEGAEDVHQAVLKQARLLEVHDRTIRGQSGHLTEITRQHQELVNRLTGVAQRKEGSLN